MLMLKSIQMVMSVVLMTASAAPAEPTLSVREPEVSNPVEHTVEFAAIVTPPQHCKVLKVWMPLPQSATGQVVGEFHFETFPEQIEPQIANEPKFGNKFAYFEFHHPQGAQIIRNRFLATVSDVHWHVDAAELEPTTRKLPELDRYLEQESLDDPAQFQQIVKGFSSAPYFEGRDILNAMDWVEQNLKYDHINASLQADPNHALRERCGHCSDYHGLCGAFGRALGIPTRVTYGLALHPKNSPSHCKLEAWLPPYGWVSFDLSETQKLLGAIDANESLSDADKQGLKDAALSRLKRGFRENSWLRVTQGTNYDLVPPATKSVRVVRTIFAEADGVPLPEPDPANPDQREFSWMTAHKYTADRPFLLPFKDLSTLEIE
ncbi:MAG: transglutaminase domain-containing protein [Planctomycetaceae bacterium]|nr:transglutaminase domain-containing protein [Planctomycetaceae bacterium]